MSLEKDLIRATVNMSNTHRDKIRGTLLSFSRRVIRETPVDTGRLRGNWQATLNVPIMTPIDRVEKRQGGVPLAQAKDVTERLQIGNIFWLTNNLPYARRIEEGWSQQAPEGMLRRNVALLLSKLK